MVLYFITGNKNKFAEAKSILGDVEMLDIELPEIQEIDPKKIIEAKLMSAREHKKGDFIVEDTSLSFECLKGLPGPFIKWFMQTMGREGLAVLCESMGNTSAEARCIVGYSQSSEIQFFEGVVKGKVVRPRGDSQFGFDPIFEPEGQKKTFAEMGPEEKNQISHRRLALNKLKDFLAKKGLKA